MSRLHKMVNFPLIKKYYVMMILLICYGFYKNGIVPFMHGYNTFFQMFIILIIPIISYGIGAIFDLLYKNNDVFNSKFYSLLFCMILPVNINILLYIFCLVFLLYVYNTLLLKKIDYQINLIAAGKLCVIGLLLIFKSYVYENNLEITKLFQYSFIDILIGHNISGVFISSIILIIISLLIFSTDEYYKKEIPIYSYGMYLLSLFPYTFFKQNMSFLLANVLKSNILFALVFIASLSPYTPYIKKRKLIYSILLGITILPFSLFTNFQEGIYISIVFANIIIIFLNFLLKENNFKVKFKRIKAK